MALKQLNAADKERLRQQVSAEVEESRKFVQNKREDFKDRLRLYNNQKKDRTKIGVMTIYAFHNVHMALSYVDELSVKFEAREQGDTQKSNLKTMIAKFDHEEMNMPELDYFTKWDKFFYGVGIRYIGSWDKELKVPIVKSFSPLLWLPDPAGYGNAENFRWHGIEDEVNKSHMTEANGYYEDVTQAMQPNKDATSSVYDLQEALSDAQNTDIPMEQSTDINDYKIQVIHHFTKFNGKKVLVTIDAGLAKILRYREVDPVSEAEKKDPTRCPWGLVLNYYSPIKGDPFGVSLTDIIEDKQRALSILANIQLLKEQAALWPMYVYNRLKIPNKGDLNFAFNKFIGINGDISGSVEPLKKDLNSATSINQEQKILAEAQFVTGTDQIQMGVLSSESRTKHEIQQVSVNSSLRQLLHAKVDNWGEKAFWGLWSRAYDAFFSDKDEKVIRITSSLNTSFKTIRRRDFATKSDPDIIIESKLESDAKRNEKRLAYAQGLPMLLQSPSTPQAAKNFALRKNFELSGMDDDEILMLVPSTPEEMLAQRENELLGNDEFVKINSFDDHMEHMFIHNCADDSPAKRAHIQAHNMAYMLSSQRLRDQANQQEQEGGNLGAAQNIAQAQIGSQAAQQGAQQTTNPVPVGA